MRDKSKRPGDIVREISLVDLLTSIGILTASVASDVIGTDKMYGERWQIQTARALGGTSELLASIVARHGDFLAEMKFDLPDNIIGVVTVNPLRGNSMSTPSSEDEGYDIDWGDDFPF